MHHSLLKDSLNLMEKHDSPQGGKKKFPHPTAYYLIVSFLHLSLFSHNSFVSLEFSVSTHCHFAITMLAL